MKPESSISVTPPLNPDPARIKVRSRRQAMDWSLVLASQGIESIIDFSNEAGEAWGLLVDPKDYTTAIRHLRQYQVENRGWPWTESLSWPNISFHWGSLLWAGLLALFYWFSSVNPQFVEASVMNKAAVLHGEWWRLFTAMLLHADLGHLATNLSLGIVLLGLAMGRFGAGLGLLAATLAGAGGNLAFLLVHSGSANGLGSSGMVMGALGLLAGQSLTFRRVAQRPLKNWLAGLAAGFMLFVLFGLSPDSDTVVHLGGFLSGLVIGVALMFVPGKTLHNHKLNLAAIFSLALVLALTCRLALR